MFVAMQSSSSNGSNSSGNEWESAERVPAASVMEDARMVRDMVCA